MDAHNTFEAPEVVDEKDFTAYENTQTGVKVTLPACSVVTLRIIEIILKQLFRITGNKKAGCPVPQVVLNSYVLKTEFVQKQKLFRLRKDR